MDPFKLALKSAYVTNRFNFKGRANRWEYIYLTVFNSLLGFAFQIIPRRKLSSKYYGSHSNVGYVYSDPCMSGKETS